MGSKRGRLLIRQPRVKKDNDHLTGHSSSPDVDPDNHQLHLHQQQQHQHHHHHQQQQQQHNPTYTTRYLQIPPKIERHASEPAPSTITLLSPHLLSVPQPSFLVKQHSHPVLPSQQSQSPPITTYTLQRQLSHPVTTQTTQISQLTTDTIGNISTTLAQLVASSIKAEDDCLLVRTKYQHQHQQQSQPQQQQSQQHQQQISPTVVIVTDPMQPSDQNVMPSIRVKTEELQRSISTPQATRELSVENPRSSHCPVVRDGPALGCNFCWNTIDGHGRILRRKTKYHCPECQTNLCIVPCFQEYHERQANDTTNNDNNSTTSTTATTKNLQPATLRHYPKTGSL